MYRKTYARVDLGAIRDNIKSLAANLPAGTDVMAVVKADAYGHGAVQVARAALAAGAQALAVAMPEEALELREAGIAAPVLVMGRANPAQAELSVTLDLWQCAFSRDDLFLLEQIAKKAGKKSSVHIKVDTGMSRIGIRSLMELDEMLDTFRLCPHTSFDGLFTHFACADEEDLTFTEEQNYLFQTYIETVRAAGYDPKIHAGNSAGCLRPNGNSYHLVRCGISMYGYYPSDVLRGCGVSLRPAMQVFTEISQVKVIEAGTPVGYGSSFVAPGEMKLATVQIGYGDGYPRLLSNAGRMLVNGIFVPVVGRVCMDQTMIDVTDAGEVAAGDVVTVMGGDAEVGVWADEIAEQCGTISYEVLLDYTKRVPREYING